MPEIALRTYIEQLDTLIERKQIDEVVAHCRHLLSFYPKHLDTYRMLGKALLEKGRHGDAADIFQRVLSVVPDDFIAHVGMSIVREDEANLDAAIWHMERAFEAAPANGAIQQELCRLYGRRDGVVPAKARLTRGALARMYAQGGLFLQAEAELRAALADEPDRIDLQTVMARVYAQSDQPAQAAQTCAGILQKLPYSLEANRILYGIFRAQGRPDDATAYRKRVEALDPYEALVDPNGGNARRVEANKIVLDRLEYAPGMEDSGSPDWLASIGAKFEEPSTRPADAQPAWMTAPEPVTPAEADAAENAPAPTGGSELPDWLRDLQPSAPAAAPEPTAAPDWLRDLGVTSAPLPSAPAANADLPDWLQTATGPMADSAVPEWMRPALETPPAGSTDDTLIGTPPAAAATDETLVGTPANTAATKPFGAPAAPEPEGDDIPAWLVGAAVAAKVVLPTGEAAPPAETGDDDLPEWLRSMSPATLEAAGAPEPTPAAAAGELPDWMQSAQETATETPTPVAVGEAGDLPDWMKGAAEPAAEMPAAEAPAPAATPPEDELPDWMQGLAAEAAVEASPPASDQMDTLVPGQTEAMTPVADSEATLVSPAAAVRLGEDEVPEWLRPGAAPESSAPEPDWLDALKEAGTAETPTLAAAEIPDWLKPAAPVDAAPADDVPAWLEAAGSAAAADEVPAWMRAPEPNAAAAPAEASAPAEAETPARPMDDVPDWLRPAVPGEAVAAMPVAEVPPAAVERPADEDGVPDWLRALPAADATPPAPQQVPDWLKGIAVEAPAPDPLGAKAAVDLPDFLQPASPEAIARAERPFELQGEDDRAAEPEPDEPALVMPAEIPDWLKGLAPVEADPVASIGAVAAATTAAAAETLAEPEPAAASDDTLNWLASLTAQPPQAGEPLADLPPDVPPWAEPATPGPSDTIANWLAGRSSNEATPAAPAPAMEAPSLAEESAQETPAGELPPWAETEAPGPTDTIIGWLTAKDVLAAQPTAPETPAEPPVAETPAAPLEPSAAADLDGDEALRWLESLATRQGANPDELLTAPEDRSSEPPAWMAAEAAAPGPLAEAAEPEAEAEPAELPDWLKALEPAAGVEPPMAAELPVSEPVMAETTAAVEPAAEAEATPLDGDEALRWLEDLAARQGANPEELLTTPEERLSEAPAWAAAEVAAGEAVAETSPAVDSPAAEAPAEPPVEAVATPAAELPPAEMPLQR